MSAFASRPWRLRCLHLRETITEVEGSGWIHQDRLTLRQLAGRWQERPLRVTGDVRDPFAVAEFDLRVQGEVDLAPLARHLDAPWPLAGMATVAVDVRGRSDAPEISGRVSVPRLTAAFIHARDVAARGDSGARPNSPCSFRETWISLPSAGTSSRPGLLGGVARVAADVQGASGRPGDFRESDRLATHRGGRPGSGCRRPCPVAPGSTGPSADHGSDLRGNPAWIREDDA